MLLPAAEDDNDTAGASDADSTTDTRTKIAKMFFQVCQCEQLLSCVTNDCYDKKNLIYTNVTCSKEMSYVSELDFEKTTFKRCTMIFLFWTFCHQSIV